MRKHLVTAVALATATVTTATFTSPAASTQAAPRGTTSLAEVLAAWSSTRAGRTSTSSTRPSTT